MGQRFRLFLWFVVCIGMGLGIPSGASEKFQVGATGTDHGFAERLSNDQGRDQDEVPDVNLTDLGRRCGVQADSEPRVYSSHFRWNLSPAEMKSLYEETYSSGNRLDDRAYYDKERQQYILPFRRLGEVKLVALGRDFIHTLTSNIQKTLKLGYGEYVFFPDMGHSHFYFEKSHWNEVYVPFKKGLPVKRFNELYEKMLNDKKLYSLFHTAEQLRLLDDDKNILDGDYFRFRWSHRNPTLPSDPDKEILVPRAEAHPYNTVRDIEGYESWSAGFYISASTNGCFPFYTAEGKLQYFDLSLKSLPPGTTIIDAFSADFHTLRRTPLQAEIIRNEQFWLGIPYSKH